MAVVFQKISKMKAGFGNLVEICDEMIEKQRGGVVLGRKFT